MFGRAYIHRMSHQMAANLGLHSEEEIQEFLRQQREEGEKAGESWLQDRVLRARGKDTSVIPRGDYCYESWIAEEHRVEYEALVEEHGDLSSEAFLQYVEWVKERRCPYQEYTAHGTVICHFLEEEAIGFHEEDFEKAVRHFGSEEEAENQCTGSVILYDSVACCGKVLTVLENEGD